MSEDFFQANNVSFSYYRKPLCLSEVSFSMQKGEKTMLLATHEMGKTTFLAVMSTFESNYFGKILLDGKELKSIDDAEKNFSFLPSNPVLFEKKSVIYNLKYNSNFSDEKVDELLLKFNVSYLKNKIIKKLLLFEKRLVAILRSERKPHTILFFDDQFENLTTEDALKMTEIYEKILCDNQKTVLFSIDSKTYLKFSELFKKINPSKVLYLVDSKVFEYKSINHFENSIDNINQIEFFENNYKKFTSILSKENDEFYVLIDETLSFKINPGFYDALSKLKLSNNDDEDIILVFQDNIDISGLNFEQFNDLINTMDLMIFSNIDGSRIL